MVIEVFIPLHQIIDSLRDETLDGVGDACWIAIVLKTGRKVSGNFPKVNWSGIHCVNRGHDIKPLQRFSVSLPVRGWLYLISLETSIELV
jgi:hypothetical protein